MGMKSASTEHVTNAIIGYAVGAGVVGVATAVAGPVIAPLAVGASLLGWTAGLGTLGGALGAWVGYNRADAKAAKFGYKYD